jgi:hypothetical protein
VKGVLVDRQLTNAWLEQRGLVQVEGSDENPYVLAAAAKVTQKQIDAWYPFHKQEFGVVNSVHVYHLACVTQAKCMEGREALRKGEKAADVVKKYGDSQHQGKVDLGVMTRQKNGLEWMASFAMMQTPGSYSKAIRAPDGHWEVVWVSKKQAGYLPADSETVRTMGARSIARAKLLEQHNALIARLRGQVKIVIN